MKLTQQKHLAGKRIERAGQLFIRPGLLFRRHRWSLNDILPARHLIRLVPFPKLLVVIVNGFGRYRVLERFGWHPPQPGLAARALARPGMTGPGAIHSTVPRAGGYGVRATPGSAPRRRAP